MVLMCKTCSHLLDDNFSEMRILNLQWFYVHLGRGHDAEQSRCSSFY